MSETQRLERDWSITIGRRLEGGRDAFVAEAVTHDGTPVVLKLAGEATFDRELDTLLAMDGDPYVRVLRHDRTRRAMLLERLGPPMAALGWPAERQLETLAELAVRGWRPATGGPDAARWHAGFIPAAWEELGRPCPESVARKAVEYARARAAAFDPRTAMRIHGDVHHRNALQSLSGFRLVDPLGIVSEPAHELGVILARGADEWTAALAAAEPWRARAMIARASRGDTAVAQWAYVELVATGLHVLRLGDDRAAGMYLTAAARLAGEPARMLLMVGLPGAGKTTRARELAGLRLTPDEWMIPLFGDNEAGGKRDVLEGRLVTVALQALRHGTDVVLDFGLWGRDERAALRWLAGAVGAACEVRYLPVDRDTQLARIAHRQDTAPHTTFPMTEADVDGWRAQFQVPDAVELAGGAIPAPPAGFHSWTAWAEDRWPSLETPTAAAPGHG